MERCASRRRRLSRVIGIRTAESHVAHNLGKLEVAVRRQAAAIARQQALGRG
jgi:hypothetical protein